MSPGQLARSSYRQILMHRARKVLEDPLFSSYLEPSLRILAFSEMGSSLNLSCIS